MLDLILMFVNSLLVGFQGQSCTPGRDHRIASSIDRAATNAETKAARPQSGRSMLVGVVLTIMVGLAFFSHHRQA